MCGIVGSINFKLDKHALKKAMIHRGPDEQSGYVHGPVDLFHFRLSILDIVSGKQPMHLDERFTIIFNGEIYNHLDLRAKYRLNCATNSDTETLLRLYEKEGMNFLNDVDGMFAFALYDKTKNKIFLVRDRAGKKPIYLYNDGQKIVWASELNGLKSVLPLEINDYYFCQYLRLGSFYRNQTPYKKVQDILAGSYVEIDTVSMAVRETRWWKIEDFYTRNSNDDFETAKGKVDQFLQTAVKRRIESSDLEVGSFLSGGIDSGLVTAIAANFNRTLKTFTVSFSDEYDEAPLAKMVAEKYNTDHHEIKITFDNLQDDLEKIILNYGEPFADSSAVPSYYVSEAAKKYLTVVLNGDGADELFGGYRRYVPFSKFNFFQVPGVFRKMFKGISTLMPASHNRKSNYNYFYRLFELAGKSGIHTYLSATADIFEGFENKLIFDAAAMKPFEDDFQHIVDLDISGLQKIMALDFDVFLFSDLLVKMDIATMAHSLEGRSPFLAKELLEYAPGLKDSYKINGIQTKYILRKLAEKYLPEKLINQPKRGFEIPLKKWVEDDIKDIVFDYINSPSAYWTNFIDKSFIEALMHKKIAVSDEKRAKMLLMF